MRFVFAFAKSVSFWIQVAYAGQKIRALDWYMARPVAQVTPDEKLVKILALDEIVFNIVEFYL